MKGLPNILAIAGFVLVAAAVAGRFYDFPTIVGTFAASSLLTAANTLLISSLVVSSLKK